MNNFFDKELVAREVPGVPGMLWFDPCSRNNRGWFKEEFFEERMLPLGLKVFFAEAKLHNVSFSRKNVL